MTTVAIPPRVQTAALLGLVVALPLQSVLVISNPLRIPPYVLLLPALTLVAGVVWLARPQLPAVPVLIAIVVWIAVTTLSLVMWLVVPPPHVDLAPTYGRLRASDARGLIQLAITIAYLAALPLAIVLGRGRERLAAGAFVVVGSAVAAYAIWQACAFRWGLPLKDISNDVTTAGRSVPSWRGLVRPRSTFGEPAGVGNFLLGPFCVALAVTLWPTTRRVQIAAAVATAVVFGAIVLTLAGAVFIALPLVAVLFVAAVAHRRSWGRGVLATAGLVATAVLVLAPFLTAARMPVERVVVVQPPKTTTTTTTTPKPKPTKKPPTPQTKIVTVTDPDAVTGRSGIAAVLDVPSILAKRITDSLSSGELSTRKSIQRYELHLWRRYPVLGVGIGAADRHLAAQFSPRSLPSTYGVWWGVVAETGTLGLLAFVAVVAAFAWELVRTLRARPTSPWYPLLVGALVGVLAQLLSYGSFSERVDAHVWMLMGLGLLAAHAARRGEPV